MSLISKSLKFESKYQKMFLNQFESIFQQHQSMYYSHVSDVLAQNSVAVSKMVSCLEKCLRKNVETVL